MDRYLGFQFKLCNAAKIFVQDRGLDLKLVLVARVLIVTTPAALEIRAVRINSLQRSLQNRFRSAPREAALLFNQCRFDSLAFKHKWHEHSFTGTLLIGREACEAVAAINKFFDGELQARILCWKLECGIKRIVALQLTV